MSIELTVDVFLGFSLGTRSRCSLPWNWAVSWRCQELHARCKRRREHRTCCLEGETIVASSSCVTLQFGLGTLVHSFQLTCHVCPQFGSLNWALDMSWLRASQALVAACPSSGRVLSLQWRLGWKQVVIWMKELSAVSVTFCYGSPAGSKVNCLQAYDSIEPHLSSLHWVLNCCFQVKIPAQCWQVGSGNHLPLPCLSMPLTNLRFHGFHWFVTWVRGWIWGWTFPSVWG